MVKHTLLKSAAINLTATGSVVATVDGKEICVVAYDFTLGGTTPTATWRSGGATNKSGAFTGSRQSSTAFPGYLFKTTRGESLDLVLAGTTPSAQGVLTYYEG